MTGSLDPLESDQDEVDAWARTWANPVPAFVERFGADRLPEGIRERADILASQIHAEPTVESARRALADALTDAADAARNRFTASSEPADADVAIALYQAAVAATLLGSTERALLQISLARTHLGRRLIDREDEVSVGLAYDVVTEALATLDVYEKPRRRMRRDEKPRRRMRRVVGHEASRERDALVEAHGAMAEILSERFSWRGEDADLDNAIAHATRSRTLAENPTDALRRARADDRLALLLRLRHDHRGDDHDLDLAIMHAEAAVAGTPTDDPEYAIRLGNLGLRLATRFNIAGDRADLDRSIALAQAGLAIIGLSPHDRRRLLGNLAIRLKTRHAQASDPDDLDAAIAMEAQAMTLAPAGTPQPLWLLNNYSVSLSARYTRRGDPADLDRAITLAEEALALSPPGTADRPSRLSNLSIVLSTRYEHRGDPADLDRAIELSGQSIAETPVGSPFLNIRQHNHGTHLAIRYDRQGAPADLDDAIELARVSIDGTPEDSPDQPSRRSNLALRYAARYAGRGRPEDLEAAIQQGELALAITPSGALERPIRLANLASALAHRWQHDRPGAGDVQARHGRESLGPRASLPATREGGWGGSDLDRAIALITEAIDLVEPGNPERASSLATRGRLLHRRYEAHGSADDLTAAIADAQAAVDATPGGHPGNASRLSLLASLTALSDDPVTWGRALDLHRQAWATVTSTPGFSGFAVVGIGNALAGTLHAHLEGVRENHVAGDPSDELWRVLTGTLAALEGYLARLPLDADDDALFTVGTYGHLYAWLIDVAVRRVEEANARGDDSVALVREAFAAIERSKGRRVISRLQAGALRPTPAALPLVEALERLKPEIDRLETLLFGGSEPPRPGSEANEYPSGTSLGWLGERLPIAPGLRASRPPRLEERLGTAHAWVPDTDAARQRSDRARMAARHAELQAEFADLLRQIERSDPTYATARGYAAPRSPEAVAQALPRGAVLAVFAPMADRTAVVVVRPSGYDKPRRRMRREMPRRRMRRVEGQQASIALETIAISEAQWVRLVDRTFRRVDGLKSDDGELSLTALDRELEGTLRAVGDRLIPKLATLLPDYDKPRRRTSTRITRRVGDVPHPTSQHLVIVPTGAMHRLPLHAVPWAPAGIARWDGSTRLADRFIVSYASMADVLPLVTPRPVADQGVASIAPGLGLHAHDAEPHATVALAAALAREASRATEPDRDEATVALRLGAEASREELLARRVLTGRRFGFVATHGRAGGTVGSGLLVHRGHRHDAQVKPLPPPIPTAENASSPTLGRQRRETGDGTWVSSAEILARLNLDGVDHLQMLACSTHADDPAPGDHLGSLLTALLICGARSVGGTLWAVDEVAAVLVGYRVGTALIRGEADKAQALRDATQWLRQATGAEIAEVLAELRDAVFERVPNADRVRIALADVVDRFRAHASHASTPPFADVVHWGPYVLHGAPLVGSHG